MGFAPSDLGLNDGFITRRDAEIAEEKIGIVFLCDLSVSARACLLGRGHGSQMSVPHAESCQGTVDPRKKTLYIRWR